MGKEHVVQDLFCSSAFEDGCYPLAGKIDAATDNYVQAMLFLQSFQTGGQRQIIQHHPAFGQVLSSAYSNGLISIVPVLFL